MNSFLTSIRLKFIVLLIPILVLACSTEPTSRSPVNNKTTDKSDDLAKDTGISDTNAPGEVDINIPSTEPTGSSSSSSPEETDIGGEITGEDMMPSTFEKLEADPHIDAKTMFSADKYCIATLNKDLVVRDIFSRDLPKQTIGNSYLIESFPQGDDFYLLVYQTAKGTTSFYVDKNNLTTDCSRTNSILKFYTFNDTNIYSDKDTKIVKCKFKQNFEKPVSKFGVNFEFKDGLSIVSLNLGEASCGSGNNYLKLDPTEFWYLGISGIRAKL